MADFDPTKLLKTIEKTREELEYQREKLANYEGKLSAELSDGMKELYTKRIEDAKKEIASLEKKLAKNLQKMEDEGHDEESLKGAAEEAKYQSQKEDLEAEKANQERWKSEAETQKANYEALKGEMERAEGSAMYDTYRAAAAKAKQMWSRASSYVADIQKTIDRKQKALDKVEVARAKKAAEANGEVYDDGRNVKPLRDFLDQWRDRVYNDMLEEMKSEARKSFKDKVRKAYEEWKSFKGASEWSWLLTKEEEEERGRLHAVYHELNEDYAEKYGMYEQFEMQANARKIPVENWVKEMLDEEWVRKYDDLLHRIEKHVGKLADASYLSVGKNGSINGRVIGEDGRQAYVETIIAGGPIQRLHYRVIIKSIRIK